MISDPAARPQLTTIAVVSLAGLSLAWWWTSRKKSDLFSTQAKAPHNSLDQLQFFSSTSSTQEGGKADPRDHRPRKRYSKLGHNRSDRDTAHGCQKPGSDLQWHMQLLVMGRLLHGSCIPECTEIKRSTQAGQSCCRA